MTTLAKPSASVLPGAGSRSFAGFESLTANFLYCPNQFFDVCLRHYRRGCVRFVAYLLRRTLGWLDEDGNPVAENIGLSWRDLIENAGISRGAIGEAGDDAVAARFVRCTHEGSPDRAGQRAETGSYMLRWDEGNQYTTDADAFRGFYAGEGHRTPIPNAFFDEIIPHETLAVVRIVGSVLRHTVGYQTKFGRRPHAALSFDYLHNYTGIRDRTTLSQAIQYAVDVGYIQRVQEGRFDPRDPTAAVYAPKWRTVADDISSGSKSRPGAVHNPDQASSSPGRFKNPTTSGSENRPVNQFKNPTTEKTPAKNTSKQQPQGSAVAADNSKGYAMLMDQGFDESVARHLASVGSVDEIANQIAWLPKRNARMNPLGMLRRAIEQSWAEPVTLPEQKQRRSRQKDEMRDAERATEQALLAQQRQRQQLQRDRWLQLSPQAWSRYFDKAEAQTSSPSARSLLRRRRQDPRNPPTQVLAVMAADQGVGD